VTTSTPKSKTKPTVTTLQKSLAALEIRMKRADTLTRKSVAALESTVQALDTRTKKAGTAHKAALTRKVNQLSAKLTDMVAQAQAGVNAELKTALDNPSAGAVEDAIARAEARLSESEAAQAAAIAKINRHLANLATAIDARFETEGKTRKAEMATLQTQTQQNTAKLTERIQAIETDSAAAFSQIGDKMAQITEELRKHGEAGTVSIREKVSEIALQTQTEFEQYRANLDRRVETLERSMGSNNPVDTQRLERMMNGLASRIEDVEYGLANMPTQIADVEPQLQVTETGPLAQNGQATQTQMVDAFTPAPLPAMTTAPAAQPNPYLAEVPKEEPEPERESHVPVEFNPATMMAPQSAPQVPQQVSKQAPPHAEHFDQAPPLVQIQAPPVPDISLETPYADPAYAEADPTMDQARIGGDNKSVSNIMPALPALPKLTGSNLRIAALATGVAVFGLVGFKMLSGGNDSPANSVIATAPAQAASPITIPGATPDTNIAPIGDYADNRAPDVPVQGEAAKTLTSAVASGDKVAQFQLGLSYLEQGRTDEGIDLIRKSANQNQPAAQYRLAKLYEIGEGVAQDSDMARQLTERAARNGNRIAMHDLALYYAEGRGGVETDLSTAAKWFEKAAERGVVDSQFNLGVLFESGQGLPKNTTDAFVWYSIAATQGDQFAKTRVDVMSDTMAEADLTAAQTRVRQFSPVKIDEAANGIFRNVPWAKPINKTAQQVSQVRRAQTLLTQIGFDIGGADGAIGPKTRAAIISFERSNSLPETGRVNADLIDRLELASGA